MGTPHDAFFHFTFQHAQHAGPWLRSLLPAALAAHLRWSTLRPIPDRLHGRALRLAVTDDVFTVKFVAVRGRSFFLIEHRSHGDVTLHGTMVRYTVHLAHAMRRERSTPATPVLPVVLYHGPGPVVIAEPAPANLAAVDPEVAELVRSVQPQLAPFVDDLSGVSEQDLLARNLTPLGTLTLLSLRFLPGLEADAAMAAIDRWGSLLRAVDEAPGPPVGSEAIENFGWYVLHVTDAEPRDVQMAIQRHLPRTEGNIMSTAERLRLQGEQEGWLKGRIEGKAEGELAGRATALLRLLARRFGSLPATIPTRVLEGSGTELDRWTDRVLDAPSLEAVFAVD